jgi:hypothetical protein
VGQLPTENALLAVAGGGAGVLVASLAVKAFVALAPSDLPLVTTIHLDAAALAGAFAITVVALMLFGLVPALVASRADTRALLSSGARHSTDRSSRMARETLVGAQIALALVVLSAAALITRSLVKLQRADLEFDSSHLLVAELAIHYDRYGSVEQQLPVLRQLLTELQSTPSIEAVSPIVAGSFSGTGGMDGRRDH